MTLSHGVSFSIISPSCKNCVPISRWTKTTCPAWCASGTWTLRPSHRWTCPSLLRAQLEMKSHFQLGTLNVLGCRPFKLCLKMGSSVDIQWVFSRTSLGPMALLSKSRHRLASQLSRSKVIHILVTLHWKNDDHYRFSISFIRLIQSSKQLNSIIFAGNTYTVTMTTWWLLLINQI